MKTTTKRSRCRCGGVRAKEAIRCTKCDHERMAECAREAAEHVARGTCPLCGTKLVYNNASIGWWQCGAYACEAMRQAEFKGLPSCGFQCFTK